jgi:hypothetical protein
MYRNRFRLRLITLGAMASTGLVAIETGVRAQNIGTAEPEAIVERYLELHNTHQLNAVMELYAPDATFALNMGREPVQGRDAIRELERFDVYAKSTVQPHGLTYERRGSGWAVHLAGVIEHSDVFSALGMVIVRAEPTRDAFVISDGFIRLVTQPEIKAACRKIAGTGFAAMTKWLVETGDPRAPDVAPAGKLRLVPGTIPLVVSAITDWRRAAGWAPDPAEVRQCALP